MTTLKLCVHCRHAEYVPEGTNGAWYCRHPVAGWYRAIDVVTGKNQTVEVPCNTARQIGQCGYDDPKFWEAKDSAIGFV